MMYKAGTMIDESKLFIPGTELSMGKKSTTLDARPSAGILNKLLDQARTHAQPLKWRRDTDRVNAQTWTCDEMIVHRFCI